MRFPLAAVFALALVALAAGCAEDRPAPEGEPVEAGAEVAAEAVEPPAGEEAPPPAVEEAEEPGAEAAVEVIVTYFSAIARRDFARAYSLWAGEGAASGQGFEDFRAGYADTESVSVEIGVPGRVEPAAGSRWVRVPVEIAARLADGTDQCFRGGYTLRRSVVDGASEDERRWRIDSADVAPCGGDGEEAASADAIDTGEPAAPEAPVDTVDPAGPIDTAEPGGDGADAESAAATAVVERFGRRLARVSLLAPPDALRGQIEAEYGPLVTSDLLAAWLADPATAPGREASSPWPERIEVREVVPQEGGFRVTGEVVYVSSVEQAAGGAARREPVAMTVVPGAGGGWRIASYERR